MKAIIADDHPLFRVALRQALEQVLGTGMLETGSLQETLNGLAEHPDIELVFLDLNMPGNEGLTGLSKLRHQHPDVLVVIVSADESPSSMRKAMELGASGYIPKSTSLDDIAEAVHEVLEGNNWFPPDLPMDADTQQENRGEFAARLESLTPHQFTVLKMMSDGLLNKQIAYELGVKETTIKQHGSAILRKLGVNNRTQAGVMFKQTMGIET